jgi:transglutaminase-like putative cysteine protease
MTIIDYIKSRNLILYFGSFLLFWQWLKPLGQITNLGSTHVFVIFIAISLGLSMLKAPLYVSVPIHFFAIVYFLHGFFFDGAFFSFLWISDFLRDMIYNWKVLMSTQWWEMTNSFRTFLFFILLWILSYLIANSLQYKWRIFIFMLLTVVYLAVIDTFFSFDGEWPMLQTISIGFFLLGYLNISRIQKLEKVTIKIPAVIAMLSVFLIFVFSISFLLPKFEPQWPDPVPHIQSTAMKYQNGYGDGGVKKIGYGVNDEQLGGPFVGDNTPVFQAKIDKVHYWKVETKDVYSGKGWRASGDEHFTQQDPKDIRLETYDDAVETESVSADITYLEQPKNPHLIYAPELKALESVAPIDLYVNENTEKLRVVQEDGRDLVTYSFDYEHPSFSIDELEKSGTPQNPELIDRYTQLPGDVPDRVKELAEEITKDATNNYERAKLVEAYLTSADFVYDTKDVEIPGEDDDYVDQFLFDSKKGYCDNFSTSMAVLLRTLDIPARWVKGYTSGSYQRTLEDGKRIYEIKNDNAHSWVEVYFEGIGWVPFEPTKGFSNPFEFSRESLNSDEEDEQQETEEEAEEEEKEEEESGIKNDSFTWTFNIDQFVKGLFIFGAFVSVLAILAYFTKKSWYGPLLIYRYKRRTDDKAMIDAFHVLLKKLDRQIIKYDRSQTLREYAAAVDDTLGISDMKALTNQYEKMVYSRNSSPDIWKESYELWENLIKKLSS